MRDTKLEKTNHEGTPKHQGNLRRFLRDLHRGNEREERDKQRAKDEVARLNGAPQAPGRQAEPASSSSISQGVSIEERKRQMVQLAEMGVAVPEEFRGELALASEWTTISTRIIAPLVKPGENEDSKEATEAKLSGVSIGARKRKIGDDEDDEETAEEISRKPWGSGVKVYPGRGAGDDDLDALLSSTKAPPRRGKLKEEDGTIDLLAVPHVEAESTQSDSPKIKKEELVPEGLDILVTPIKSSVAVKAEEDGEDGGVVFKKRKPKSIRQK